MKTTLKTKKKRTEKSARNSWSVRLIVWDGHGRKMQRIHKVKFQELVYIKLKPLALFSVGK